MISWLREHHIELEKSSLWPSVCRLAWYTRGGISALPLNINNFTDHHHQTKPFCDHDELRPKRRPLCNIVHVTKMTKYHFILENVSDYCPFTNYSLAFIYTLIFREDLVRYPGIELPTVPDSIQWGTNIHFYTLPQICWHKLQFGKSFSTPFYSWVPSYSLKWVVNTTWSTPGVFLVVFHQKLSTM